MKRFQEKRGERSEPNDFTPAAEKLKCCNAVGRSRGVKGQWVA